MRQAYDSLRTSIAAKQDLSLTDPAATGHLRLMGKLRRGVVNSGNASALLTGPLGAYLLAGGTETGGAVSFVIHTLSPRALGSPVHTHRNEDEWSYVLSGAVGIELDGDVSVAEPNDLILKPRGVPHAFWNASDEPARLLEVITPAGFEDYFARLAEVLSTGGAPNPAKLAEVAEAFGLELDPSSIPRLVQAHGLHLA
jgi:quercetin dioxygenase-like cupin family protein